jgi:hypothetical protein
MLPDEKERGHKQPSHIEKRDGDGGAHREGSIVPNRRGNLHEDTSRVKPEPRRDDQKKR